MFRCKAKYQKLCFLLIFLGTCVFYIYSRQHENRKLINRTPMSEICDLNKVNNIMNNLCDLYSKSTVHGKLCNSFCSKRKSYKLVKCYNNYKAENFKNNDLLEQKYDDYKIVMEYKFNDIDDVNKYFNGDEIVILKSRHKYFFDFDHYVFDVDKMKSVELLKNFFRQYLESTISHNFKFDVVLQNEKVYSDYLVKLFDAHSLNLYEKAVENNDVDLLRSYILNFLSLLQQEEYLFYKYFQNKQNILQIYGTCGHIYAIEKAASLKSTVKTIGLEDRKRLILDFLSLVQYFDNEISSDKQSVESKSNQHSMQICDVKLENFGLNKRNQLKIIDTDMIHLDENIFNGDVCARHDDCHYFDCKGFCDMSTKKCEMNRIDNNLHVICEKIFSNPIFPDEGLITGAQLVNNQIKNHLERLLYSCIDTGYYKQNSSDVNGDRVKIGAKIDVMIEMEKLLRENSFE